MNMAIHPARAGADLGGMTRSAVIEAGCAAAVDGVAVARGHWQARLAKLSVVL